MVCVFACQSVCMCGVYVFVYVYDLKHHLLLVGKVESAKPPTILGRSSES